MHVVEATDVRRRFGATPALDGLTFAVEAGSVTVLLGPNGAGKTTCTRVITGALALDSGEIRVFGLDPVASGSEVRSRIGVVSAKPALYDRLSGWDNLRYSAELHGLGRGAAAESAIRESAERFGIVNALDAQVGGYSTGMKTRLALSRSVLHHPELLLYDEPTSGLDPESSQAVLRLIGEMTADGTTVIMCTHLLAEADGLADQVIVLQDGASLVSGRPDELVERYWAQPYVLVEADDPTTIWVVKDLAGVSAIEPEPWGARIAVDTLDRIPEIIFALARAGTRVRGIRGERHTLEDLYFAVRASSSANRIGEVSTR